MARLHDVVVDCRHPASIARFWAAVLDGYQVAPYDEAELARLRAAGIFDVEDDPTVLVEGPAGQPRIFFQRVPEPKSGKNRLHLDLRCDRFADELARLRELGAVVLAEHESHIVLHDPEGNEFCLSGRVLGDGRQLPSFGIIFGRSGGQAGARQLGQRGQQLVLDLR